MKHSTSSYVASMILPAKEQAVYKNLLTLLPQYPEGKPSKHGASFSEEAGLMLGRILEGSSYSFALKAKLALQLSHIEPLGMWASENLTGEDLYMFIHHYVGIGVYSMSEDITKSLAASSSFVSSATSNFSSIGYLIQNLYSGNPMRADLGDILVEHILRNNLMNLEVAELVIRFTRKQDDRLWKSKAPVIDWARKTYDMEDLPTLWVENFLYPETATA